MNDFVVAVELVHATDVVLMKVNMTGKVEEVGS